MTTTMYDFDISKVVIFDFFQIPIGIFVFTFCPLFYEI